MAARPQRIDFIARALNSRLENRGEVSQVATLTVLILVLGFLYWFIVVLSAIAFGMSDMRKFWLSSESGALPLYDSFVFVVLLIGYALFFCIFRHALFRRPLSISAGTAYIGCIVVLAAIGRDLWVMRNTVLNDALYAWALESEEPIERGNIYLGRVLDVNLEKCVEAPSPCTSVELETGEVVVATMAGTDASSPFEIGEVVSIRGGTTGDFKYYKIYPYPVSHARMFWGALTGTR